MGSNSRVLSSGLTSPSLFQSPQKTRLMLSLLLLLATVVLYNPLSSAPFLNYDDDYYIIQNSHVRSGLSWKTVVWAFQSTELSNWHPVTWLSHAFDVQVFGMNPSGHHYVNVLLHTLNVILLFLFLERCTGWVWRSLVVAALFAIHPINVESVAWISERKNVLSMTFFLLGLMAYAWYAQHPRLRRYLVVALCFLLALMTKPQVITFPLVLLLLDYWPLARMTKTDTNWNQQTPTMSVRPISWLLLEKVPLLLLSVGSAIVTMKAQTTAIHAQFPLSVRLANALLAYVGYLKKVFWPADLAPLYPYSALSPTAFQVGLAAVFLLTITSVVLVARRSRYLLVGWLWFLGVLVPMIGVVQVGVQAMADRYAYLPFIGIFIVLVWGISEFQYWRPPRLVGTVSSSVALLVLAFACQKQIGYWHENSTLWAHTLAVTSNTFVAEDSIAMALIVKGRPVEAIPHFQNAVKINPSDPVGNLNLGIYAEKRGDYQTAIESFRRLFQLTNDSRLRSTALANLGSAYYALRQYGSAAQSFEAAIRLFPENSQALLGLGLLAQRAGSLTHAIDNYERSTYAQPTDVGYLLLAHALQANGQIEAARGAQVRAEQISPNLAAANDVVGQLLEQ